MNSLYVQVAFPGGNQLYTYRTPRIIKLKTLLVVPAGSDLKVVKAHRMIDESQLKAGIDYKWIIQEVDLTEHNALVRATKAEKSTDAKARL